MAYQFEMQVACEPFTTPDAIDCDCGELVEDEVWSLIFQASDALAIMSGGAYSGRCTETVRPRGPGRCECSCACAAVCRCSTLSGITLPAPIAINSSGDPDIEVWIDGELFPDWVLVDGNFLMRGDGLGWPGCQDLKVPSGDPGSFEIVYTYGEPVSLIAANAAIEVVCAFLKSQPSDNRRLPGNTRQVTAHGVSIQLEWLQEEIKRRSFMMPWVIRFMSLYAPDGSENVFFWSPEVDDGMTLHVVQRPQ